MSVESLQNLTNIERSINSSKENLNTTKQNVDALPLDEVIVVDDWKIKVGDLILKTRHFTMGIFRLLSYPFEILFQKRQSKKGLGEYCFTQQYNDSCHISPLMNLKILEKIRSVNYDLTQVNFYSRREWLGENQEMLTSWHHLMAQLCEEDAEKKYPAIYEYIQRGIKKGPIFPHFYNENNEIPFKGMQGLLEFSELPFFLIDFEALQKVSFRVMCMDINFEEMLSEEDLGLKTGIVQDKGVYKIYNSLAKEFTPIKDLNWIKIENVDDGEKTKSVVNIDRNGMSAEDQHAYPLPPEGYEIVMRELKGLGFSQFGVANQLGGGFKLKGEDDKIHTYIPFQMSLIKLLFIAAGLDENNQMVDAEHPDYQAYQQLQELMAENENNLWHPKQLDKDKLLQYHLVEIFKENPDLYRKTKGVVDVLINHWFNHKKVQDGNFYNVNGNKLQREQIDPYLLGDEQAIAYYLMQSIRAAWYSAINPKVLINCLELGFPDQLAPMTHQFLLAKLNQKHRIKLNDETLVTESFLSVWDEVLASLKDRTKGGRQDFMSFDDHGWVVSLDPELIKKQNECGVYDKNLIKRLGIAGIESWWGSELNLWYKQDRVKIKDLTSSNPEKETLKGILNKEAFV